MIAFMKYDLFPYVIWGKVVKTDGDKVFVECYNGWFKNPEAILPDDVAEEKIKQLRAMMKERTKELEEFNSKYEAQLIEIFPWKS